MGTSLGVPDTTSPVPFPLPGHLGSSLGCGPEEPECVPIDETGTQSLGHSLAALHVTTFLLWTGTVALLTWLICKKFLAASKNAAEDFFSGGRGLPWFVVAGSLMLTNLSTEQLVGLNGTIFMDGCLAGVAWETFAALAMCVTATVFVPRYVQRGFSTTTGYLGERFDECLRSLVCVIFLVYYSIVLCPLVLYTGALAIRTIFDLDMIPLWVVSTLIGLLGAIYALSGGLKAVAVSDCLNGVGLIAFGVWVPIAGLNSLGGLSVLFDEPAFLKPFAVTSMIFDNDKQVRTEGPVSLPWGVLATGLMVTNLYYWSTNQVIVQRVLGAKSMAHSQKGVLFAATMKVIGFSFLCLPGVIGMIMVQQGYVDKRGEAFVVTKNDEVYAKVVKAVMPSWSLGLFAAVLLGSVLSTFNSALNSASTLFGLEIYRVFINKEATDASVVKMSTVFGIVLSGFSFIIAPQLSHFDSIFSYLQKVNSMTSLPIVTVFVGGIATRIPDAFAAKCAFGFGFVTYGICEVLTEIMHVSYLPHWLHLFALCFVLAIGVMVLTTYCSPLRKLFGVKSKPKPYEQQEGGHKVDITPWKPMYPYCGMVVFLVTLISIALQLASQWLFVTFWAIWLVTLVALFVLPTGPDDPLLGAADTRTYAKNTGDEITVSESGVSDSDEE